MKTKNITGILILLICLLSGSELFALAKGDKVQCIGSGLNIRTSYSASAPHADPNKKQANYGNTGTIVDGPKNAEGYTWWRIQWDAPLNVTGWSVEKDANGVTTLQTISASDTTPPVVTSFNVTPASITQGSSVTISYTVTDSGGSELKEVRLFRAPGSGSTPPNPGTWTQIGPTHNLIGSGNGPKDGTFTDNTAPVGSFWYGVTVWDNAGREGIVTAKKVTVNSAPAAPTISSINPPSVIGVPPPQRVPLTINGSNFQSGLSVKASWTGGSATIPSQHVTVVPPSRIDITVATGVEPDTWSLQVINPGNNASNTKNFTVTAPALSAPTGVSASDGTHTDKVRVTWNSVSGSSIKYRVYRNDTNNSALAVSFDLITGTSFDDIQASPGAIYYYWVKTVSGGQESGFSNSDAGHRKSLVSPDPIVTSFDVQPRVVAAGQSVTVTFSVSDPGGSGLNRVELWRGTDNNGTPVWPQQAEKQQSVPPTGSVVSTYTGTFTDTPPATVWYGIHVVNNAGKFGTEEASGKSPIRVERQGNGLPNRDLNLNNPDDPYGLIDLDPELKPAGSLAYSKWGTLQSVGSNSSTMALGFSKLTEGPFQTSNYNGKGNPELFLFKSKTNLSKIDFPASTQWSPAGGSFNSGHALVPQGNPDPSQNVALLRKLHFRNELTNAKTEMKISNSVQSDLKKAVILIHGWNRTGEENAFSGDFSSLINQLKGKMTDNNWKLLLYRWEADADTGGVTGLTSPNTFINSAPAAAQIGYQHGQHLGELLDKMMPNIEKVHFISHSAGAWVARAAVRYILKNRPNTIVQVTLLDPFMAMMVNNDSLLGAESMSRLDNLPRSADQIFLLENYFSQDEADIPTLWGEGPTMEVFEWSDRTPVVQSYQKRVDWSNYDLPGGIVIAGSAYQSHSGPIQFYADTVAASDGSTPSNRLAPYEATSQLSQIGWRRSMYYQEQHSTSPPPNPSPKPNPPVITEPGTPTDTDYTVSTLTPIFKWNAVVGADHYTLSISKEPYGESHIVHQENYLSGTSHVVPAGKLANGVNYRWNMTTVNSGGVESVNSGTLYFKTPGGETPPPNPNPTPSSQAKIAVSGNLAFGNVAVGSFKQLTLTITNTGDAVLNVVGISHSPGVFSGDFTGSIAPGGSRDVTIAFTPISAQFFQGQLTVVSNAASGNPSREETGTGTSAGGTPQTYTLNVTADNGSVSKSPNQASYSSGTVVSLTAVPADGYEFTGWSGDASGTQNPLQVTMNAGKAITAHFSPISAPATGTVVNWGSNYDGQLNIWPPSLEGVIAITAGWAHTAALKSDGTVTTWGLHGASVPNGLNGVVAIDAGNNYTVALKSDGTVVVWGGHGHFNGYVQTTVPEGLNGVVAIAAGNTHIVALKSDGTVVAWGDNQRGQTNVPAGLSQVAAVAAGGAHTLALKSDGTVVAWGQNDKKQINVPAGLSGVVAIAAGEAQSVALKDDGTVVIWGSKNWGLGNMPADLSGVLAIDTGGYHSIALKTNGTMVAWGENDRGQSAVPNGLDGVIAIAAGGEHTVALRTSSKPVKPSIKTHPADQEVNAGQSAIFAVVAGGRPSPRSFRWQRSTNNGASWSYLGNDETYAGATTGTLTVNHTTTDMSGHRFRAIASNGLGQPAISNPATLTINSTPSPSPTPLPTPTPTPTPNPTPTPSNFDEVLTFDNNQNPAGWSIDAHPDKVTKAIVANQRFEARQVDTYAALEREKVPPAGATAVEISYTGNVANNYWGMGTEIQLVLADSTIRYVGLKKAGSGGNQMLVNAGTGGAPQLSETFAPDYGAYLINAKFESGKITFSATKQGADSPLFVRTILIPGFTVDQIRKVRLYAFTTSGETAWIDDVNIKAIGASATPTSTPLQLQSAVSRKTHGGAGTFDIDLPLTGAVGVESRSPGAAGHKLVLTFDKDLASSQEALNLELGSGQLAEPPAISGKTLTLRITGIPNASRCTVTLGDVQSADASVYSGSLTFGVLEGDVNGNRSVNVADAALIRQNSGKPVSSSNFRADINANGSVNVADTALQTSRSGTNLP